MPPAIIAGAVAAIGTIGGAAISSHAQSSAANKAAQAQTAATSQELQLGRENINFQQGIYDQNKAILSPNVERGNYAGNQLNALLGLPGAPANSNPSPQGANNNALWDGYLSSNPDVAREAQRVTADGEFPNADAYAQYHYQTFGQGEGRQLPQAQQNQVVSQTPVNALGATDAFNNFANSAGIQFQLQQGTNALQHSAAAKGMLNSGATLKALQNYGQNTALNNYFMPYLGLLQGQQATGAQSGAAIAGVGSNFGNTVSSIYGGQQNAIANGADATSNAALLRGQANANLGNSIGSALGTFGSSFFPSTPRY